MSTKMSARGIVGSLRLVGVTAAVAAGIAGFSSVDAQAATTHDMAAAKFVLTNQQSAALSSIVSKLNLPPITLKAKTCKQMDDANVNDDVLLKLGCIVIPDAGEITGGSIFS
jgi:hypothetical protein